jgi:ankyrin repeat protein
MFATFSPSEREILQGPVSDHYEDKISHMLVPKEISLNDIFVINNKDNNGYTALMIASENGHKEVVELLLNKGANINYKNDDGYTALMLASAKGHKNIVELLLNKGAHIDYKNDKLIYKY